MIIVTDTDNRQLAGIRLRPGQEMDLIIKSDRLQPSILSIQALRADFTGQPPTGEVESVSRGNGQELLDDDLIEIKRGYDWLGLSEPVEVGTVSQLNPVNVTIRVKNVGSAVGEVAFGLAFIELDLSKLIIPQSDFLAVSGMEGVFIRAPGSGDYWVQYPPPYEPSATAGPSALWEDLSFIEYDDQSGMTFLASIISMAASPVAEAVMPAPAGFLCSSLAELDGPGKYKIRALPDPEPATRTDNLVFIILNTGLGAVELWAVSGEDYTHRAEGLLDPEDEGPIVIVFQLAYDAGNGEWVLSQFAELGGEAMGENEELRQAGSPDFVPLRWFPDGISEDAAIYVLKKETP